MEQLLAHWLLICKSSGLGLHGLQPGPQDLVGLLKLSRKTHNLIQFLQNIITHRGDLSVFCFYSIEFALDDNHLIPYEHKVNQFRVETKFQGSSPNFQNKWQKIRLANYEGADGSETFLFTFLTNNYLSYDIFISNKNKGLLLEFSFPDKLSTYLTDGKKS